MKALNQSYFQDKKQGIEGARYQPIQPAKVGEIFQSHGFSLVDFKSGQARDAAYQNHQKTITRFRHNVEKEGLQNEITLIAPHLGRGVLKLILGTYRLICTNGLTVGQAFGVYNVKHLGDVEGNLDNAIATLLKQEAVMKSQIEAMTKITLSLGEQIGFAMHMASIRLSDSQGAILESVNPLELLHIRRQGDANNDLWSLFNRVQEAIVRYGFRYNQVRNVETAPNTIETKVFNVKTRPLPALSVKGVEVNQALWNEATKLIGKVG